MANNDLFYFPHNCNTQGKKDIKKLIRDLGYEGYGLYWSILEFMYTNTLEVGEEDLILDGYTEKITKILNNYGLFYIEDNQYMSDRISENIKRVEEKRKSAQSNANKRWLKKYFVETYNEIFGIEPILDKKYLNKLNELSDAVSDFKEVLPSILYTMKSIKFDCGSKPGADWLLTDTNFNKVYNRQYGWKEYHSPVDKKEQKKVEELQRLESEKAEQKKVEDFLKKFKTSEDVFEYFKDKKVKFLTPVEQQILNKFNLSKSEIEEKLHEVNNV